MFVRRIVLRWAPRVWLGGVVGLVEVRERWVDVLEGGSGLLQIIGSWMGMEVTPPEGDGWGGKVEGS